MELLNCRKLTVAWPDRKLLDGVDLAVCAGHATAVMGPSGSGKSTLLNLISGIMVPDSGSVQVDGTEITTMSVSDRAAFRLRHIGVVFQFGELLPELNVVENVSLPLMLQGVNTDEATRRSRAILSRLGVASHAEKFASDLSGGEIQRVGIARALVHRPKVVLADEPTGALDQENGHITVGLLLEAASEQNAAVLIATHDSEIAARADRCLRLQDGVLVGGDAILTGGAV